MSAITGAAASAERSSTAYIGRSFLVSFAANALLYGHPAKIALFHGAAAATAALIMELAIPFFQFFSTQSIGQALGGFTTLITFFAFPSVAGSYLGVNFNFIRTIGYSILSNLVGLESYILCAP